MTSTNDNENTTTHTNNQTHGENITSPSRVIISQWRPSYMTRVWVIRPRCVKLLQSFTDLCDILRALSIYFSLWGTHKRHPHVSLVRRRCVYILLVEILHFTIVFRAKLDIVIFGPPCVQYLSFSHFVNLFTNKILTLFCKRKSVWAICDTGRSKVWKPLSYGR